MRKEPGPASILNSCQAAPLDVTGDPEDSSQESWTVEFPRATQRWPVTAAGAADVATGLR